MKINLAVLFCFVCLAPLQDSQPQTTWVANSQPTGTSAALQSPARNLPAPEGKSLQNQAPQNQQAPQTLPASSPAVAPPPIQTSPDRAKIDPLAIAWDLLAAGADSQTPKRRSDALSALASAADDPRAQNLVEKGLSDKDPDVRQVAAAALGQMKARQSIPALQDVMENDDSLAVSFAALKALWEMGDRSGRDVLYEVLTGERHTSPGLIKTKIHDAKRDLHDPKALAMIGLRQESGALLGPFSMGLSMAEEFARDNSAPVEALCATLLGSDNSPESERELESALQQKNWLVRAAAAKALGNFPHRDIVAKLQPLLSDDKQPVRYMAAASIIRLNHLPERPSPRGPLRPKSRPKRAGTSQAMAR